MANAFALMHASAIPILDAPINATWAANHGEAWHERGFRGFVFQGILDDLRLFPSEEHALQEEKSITALRDVEGNTSVIAGAPLSQNVDGRRFLKKTPRGRVLPGDWNRLLEEITTAVNRLKSQWIGNNFLRLQIAPEAPYFSNAAYREVMVQRFRLAGEFCRQSGLIGMVLDTQSSSAMYDYRWEGHPPDLNDRRLCEEVRRTGRSALRAFFQAFPEGKALLLFDDFPATGPLWYSFVSGLLESPGAAEDLEVLLCFPQHADKMTLESIRTRQEMTSRIFQQRLTMKACRSWKSQQRLFFALEPVHIKGVIPTPGVEIAEYFRALYAAALYGRDYILVKAPQGGWWQIPPDTAAQFEHLRQGGAARVVFAPPVPQSVYAYSPRLVCENADYIGESASFYGGASILRNAQGPCALFWEYPSETIHIDNRTGMVAVTELTTLEKRHIAPGESGIDIPRISAPFLLEGVLPQQWIASAALDLTLNAPMEAGIVRQQMSISVQNPFATPLRGVLDLTAAEKYGVGSGHILINLPPGRSTRLQRQIQGIAYLGKQATFTATIAMPSSIPITKTLVCPIMPETLYRMESEGPITGRVMLAEKDAPSKDEVCILGDSRGVLSCFSAVSGDMLWKRRFKGRYRHAPRLLFTPKEEPHIVFTNDQGRVRICDGNGVEKANILLNMTEGGDEMIMAAYRNHDEDYLVVSNGAGDMSWYTAGGRLHHHIQTPYCWKRLFALNSDFPFLFAVGSLEATGNEWLAAFDVEGVMRWQYELAAHTSCLPAVGLWDSDKEPLIFVSVDSGALECIKADTGERLAIHATESGGNVRFLAVPNLNVAGLMNIYMADKEHLTKLSLRHSLEEGWNFVRNWQIPIREITAVKASPVGESVVAGLSNGAVYGISEMGHIKWEYQGTAAITDLFWHSLPRRKSAHALQIVTADNAMHGVLIPD